MQLTRQKTFYLCLCLFFVLGAYTGGFLRGDNTELYQEREQLNPQNFVGFFNNYINQKVNPSTMGDVFVTEYIEHPQEATGVIPLFPTQSIVQEMRFTNITITDLALEVVSGEDTTYGTTIGIAVFARVTSDTPWELRGYETRRTAGMEEGALQVNIGLPRTTFGAEEGAIKLVITNFGSEISDLVYLPTVNHEKPQVTLSAINTVVDMNKSLYLTVTNRYREIRGYRYVLEYKPYVGALLHQIAYRRSSSGRITQTSDEVIALFDYPSFTRVDSDFDRYSEFRSPLASLLPNLAPRSLESLENIFRVFPFLRPFVTYRPKPLVISHGTSLVQREVGLQGFLDSLVQRSQSDLDYAAQPALQTLLMDLMGGTILEFRRRHGRGI